LIQNLLIVIELVMIGIKHLEYGINIDQMKLKYYHLKY